MSSSKRSASSTFPSTDTRKRSRKDDESSTDSPPLESSGPSKPEEKVKPTRGSRACTVCRRLKMRCVGAEHGPPCKRCQTGNHDCIFEESNRGKRSTKKHEILTRSIRKMEKTLDTVLKSIGNPALTQGISRSPSPVSQGAATHALMGITSPTAQSSGSFHPPRAESPKLHSLPDNALNPLGLLAEASLANRRAQGPTTEDNHPQPGDTTERKLGVLSSNYFRPGPMTILPLRRLYIERAVQPEMLSFVSTNEVVALFDIFFNHMNMHVNVLDRDFHTASLVCSRSPFLLTTICAIASKFYTEKPELYGQLMEISRKLAFSVPSQGYKSVEIVQAYLLLTLWGCGAVERFEMDKTWMLLGMAIRMATDLSLHRKIALGAEEDIPNREAEIQNRERTWILCFALDRSLSATMGKPYTIREDSIIRSVDKFSAAPGAIYSDIAIAGYAGLQRIVSRSLDLLYSNVEGGTGLHDTLDYMLIIRTFEDQVYESMHRFTSGTALPHANEHAVFAQYTKIMGEFYMNYTLLVLNSFGLQNALQAAPVNIGHFFARVYTSAMNCASLVRDQMGPLGFLKYSPDSHCVQISYAVLSLLKLVRPEFASYMQDQQRILQVVQEVADVFDRSSANPQHTTALYAGFLRALLTSRLQTMGTPNGHGTISPMNGDMAPPPPKFTFDHLNLGTEGEMGPVMDMSTFPPKMAPPTMDMDSSDMNGHNGIAMDSILSSTFWDSVLVPGYNTMDGLAGGFVFGANGSGLITPRVGMSPFQSGTNTPSRGLFGHHDMGGMPLNADAVSHKLES
ncbi:hypothetical protein CYLTODRAFT_346620 [Cylindrobasidium torrendii FP15055 ss-10]|uniref:Zn(2)-C6 fungal-type domain-containing protein n=1 Tax=Cylindrobasidium torrendii FP15055 ss-10 TaxID=1314674 RepID=A0A0D7BKP1_9AGAR|nr:hypothetical protein CYLTODRAFT_346620 [Cylindrobasidium torrendii FP15055 ss-10]